jgi:hypothetical protein
MELLLIGFIWVLNLAISFWNAYACGKVWAETKAAGGWHRFMTWMGAIMSASGFTWCILIVVMLSLGQFGILTPYWTKIGLEMGYVLIVPGILFSGLMITIDSWATAYRQGGVLNYGVAAYNTYAQIHNTMSAISTFGDALGDIIGAFSGGGKSRSSSSSSDDDAGGLMALLVLGLVVLCACAGIAITTIIIKKVSASQPLLSLDEMKQRVSLEKK